jgi:O-antigen/teichoic acid export membrane protein
MKKALARSTVKTSAILIARTATQAISLILLTHLLNAESYGSLISASVLATILGIISNLGAGYVMLEQTPSRANATEEIWRYAWPLTLSIGSLLLCIYIPLATTLAGNNSLPISYLFCIGAVELLIMPLVTLFGFALQSKDQVPLSQAIQWLPLGLRTLAIIPCFIGNSSERLLAYVLLQLIASITGLLITVLISRNHLSLKWSPRLIHRKELKRGINYSAMHIVAANSSDIDKMLSIRFVSPSDAGIYAAATRVTSAVVMPVIALLLNSQPRIFRYSRNPSGEGKRLLIILGILTLAWGGLSWLFIHMTGPLLPYILGSAFFPATQIMSLLAFVAVPTSMRLSGGTILVALGKPLNRIAIELGGGLILLAAAYILTPQQGIRGLTMALICSEIFMAFGGWYLIYLRVREIDLQHVANP